MGAPRASTSERCLLSAFPRLSLGFPSAFPRLPLGFPAVGPIGIKAERNRWSHAKKPHHFFCDRAILTPPFLGVPPKGALHRWSHRWRGAGRPMQVNFLEYLKHATDRWSHRSRKQKPNYCNASLAFQTSTIHRWSHRWRGASRPRGSNFWGTLKKAAHRWSHRWKG